MAARFDAFISYSRRASAPLAIDLQTAVERFAKPWYRLRAVRVFRDDSSMSANVALWSTIEQGLSQAEWFVLLASPPAAASEYVANEVTWWREHKSADRILIVLEEGVDIAWDRAANDFDWERTDSLPRALSGAYAEEPRWIDLRWYEPEGSLKKADPRWLERVADVAAAVRFAERDQLIGENVREHRKAQRLLRAGIATLSVLLVLAVVAAFLAVGQRNEAQRQTRVAVEQRRKAETQARIALARQLASQAVSLAPTDIRTASLLAVQAFRTHDDAQTRAALFQTATTGPQLVRTLPAGAEVTATAVTPDGIVVTGDADGTVLLWENGEPETLIAVAPPVRSIAISDDASVVALAAPDGVTIWRSGVSTTLTDEGDPLVVALSTDTAQVAASGSDLRTTLWEVSGDEGQLLGTVDTRGSELAFGPDRLVIVSAGGTALASLDPFRVLTNGFTATTQTDRVALSHDGLVVAASTALVDYPVWRDAAALDEAAKPNAVAHTDFVGGRGLALSSDGTLLAAQDNGVLQVVPVQGLQEAAARPKDLGGTGEVSNPNAAALSFGGNRFLASAAGASAFLWDLDQYSRLGESFPSTVPVGCSACGPTRVALDPSGTRALMWALADLDTGPVIADVATGDTTQLDAGRTHGYEAFAWDGGDRVLGFAAADSALVAQDLSSGAATIVAPIPLGDQDTVMDLVVSESDAYLVSRDGRVWMVDLGSGTTTELSALVDDGRAAEGSDWSFAPDASSLAVLTYDFDTNQNVVLVLDPATDRIVHSSPAVGAAYDADSRLHVFDGSTVAVLDGDELGEPVPAAGVESAPAPVLSPDGAIVASGGRDGTISLLDLARQGTLFGRLAVPQQDNVLPSSVFTADGSTMVTALPPMEGEGLPSTIRTLSLDPDDWIAAACAVAARDLNEEDWDRYGVGPAPEDLRCVQ